MALPLLACVVLLFAFRLQKENSETITTVNACRVVDGRKFCTVYLLLFSENN